MLVVSDPTRVKWRRPRVVLTFTTERPYVRNCVPLSLALRPTIKRAPHVGQTASPRTSNNIRSLVTGSGVHTIAANAGEIPERRRHVGHWKLSRGSAIPVRENCN
jgi:hypothetical protein